MTYIFYGPETGLKSWMREAAKRLTGNVRRLTISISTVGGIRMASVFLSINEADPTLVSRAELDGLKAIIYNEEGARLE